MPKPKAPKRRLTMKDVKKLFGPNYRMPSDAELEAVPMLSLGEVFADLEKKHPPRKKASSKSKAVSEVRRELQKIQGQLNRIEKRLVKL
ncbi:MAG: hypothetical protein QM703_06430 [Gemmatales bacterium]